MTHAPQADNRNECARYDTGKKPIVPAAWGRNGGFGISCGSGGPTLSGQVVLTCVEDRRDSLPLGSHPVHPQFILGALFLRPEREKVHTVVGQYRLLQQKLAANRQRRTN
jgi:hypothetical protein